MDIAEIFVTGGGVILIGFTLWFFFGQREAESAAAGANDKYACPMHSWITSNDPGAVCSLCGMKLTERG